MLKLTIKPGEFINIGEDIRVVYSGGSEGNIHLLIDAPRELNIVRSKVLARNKEKEGKEASRFISPYYAESKQYRTKSSSFRASLQESLIQQSSTQ